MTAGATAMAACVRGREVHGREESTVHFPPLKVWDPEANITCVLGKDCSEKHHPAKCETFKGMTPQQRLARVQEWELCRLCFRQLGQKVLGLGEDAELRHQQGVLRRTTPCFTRHWSRVELCS
jgi:ribosomal protein S14